MNYLKQKSQGGVLVSCLKGNEEPDLKISCVNRGLGTGLTFSLNSFDSFFHLVDSMFQRT